MEDTIHSDEHRLFSNEGQKVYYYLIKRSGFGYRNNSLDLHNDFRLCILSLIYKGTKVGYSPVFKSMKLPVSGSPTSVYTAAMPCSAKLHRRRFLESNYSGRPCWCRNTRPGTAKNILGNRLSRLSNIDEPTKLCIIVTTIFFLRARVLIPTGI